MAQGNSGSNVNISAIYIAVASAGTTISGNTISQQNGSGLSHGIYVAGGNANLTVTGNNINILNSLSNTRGIFAYAVGGNILSLTIAGNTIIGTSYAGVQLSQTTGFAVVVFTISGNVISGGASTSTPLFVNGAEYGTVTGNTCNAASTAALYVNGSTSVRYSANFLYSTGSPTMTTVGNCTGSVFDESNSVNGAIFNGASGLNVRQLAATTPSGWTVQSGDVIYNTTGTSPFAWQYNSSSGWVGLTLP